MATTNTRINTELPLVCDLTVLTSDQHERLQAVSMAVFGRATGVEVLDNGYDVIFSDPAQDMLGDLAEFVAYDSLCCAFLEHSITVEAGPGRTHLRMTGREGARAAIAEDLAQLLPPEIASVV